LRASYSDYPLYQERIASPVVAKVVILSASVWWKYREEHVVGLDTSELASAPLLLYVDAHF
jgi:hypothetical protein